MVGFQWTVTCPGDRAMKRMSLFAFVALLSACTGDVVIAPEANITERLVNEDAIADFGKRRGAINAHNERGSPPAAALTAGGVDGAVTGVILWNPEKTGRALGFKDSDKIVAVNNKTAEGIYSDKWQGYGKYKRPEAFGTDKYTAFINDLFRERYRANEVLVTLHRKEGHGWNPTPIGLRFMFDPS